MQTTSETYINVVTNRNINLNEDNIWNYMQHYSHTVVPNEDFYDKGKYFVMGY